MLNPPQSPIRQVHSVLLPLFIFLSFATKPHILLTNIFIIFGRILVPHVAAGSASCDCCFVLFCRAYSAIVYVGCISGNDFLLFLESFSLAMQSSCLIPVKCHFATSASNQHTILPSLFWEVSDATNELITFEKFI